MQPFPCKNPGSSNPPSFSPTTSPSLAWLPAKEKSPPRRYQLSSSHVPAIWMRHLINRSHETAEFSPPRCYLLLPFPIPNNVLDHGNPASHLCLSHQENDVLFLSAFDIRIIPRSLPFHSAQQDSSKIRDVAVRPIRISSCLALSDVEEANQRGRMCKSRLSKTRPEAKGKVLLRFRLGSAEEEPLGKSWAGWDWAWQGFGREERPFMHITCGGHDILAAPRLPLVSELRRQLGGSSPALVLVNLETGGVTRIAV